METLQNIISNPVGGIIGIIVLFSIVAVGGYISGRLKPIVGYLVAAITLCVALFIGKTFQSASIIFSFLGFLSVGLFLGAGSKSNKYKTGEWPKARPSPPSPVVVTPPPSPFPVSQPQTVIHYTDNRDQSIRIDNSVKITVGDLNRDSARELLGLPAHFTNQRLENAYEDKIRILDAQAQALPRNDTKNRLLISQQEDRLEQAYEVLKRDKEG